MPGYLIIGGTGSLGQKLIQRILTPALGSPVSVYSRDEGKHWTIANQLANHPNRGALKFHVGDIRDKARLKDVIRRTMPDTIIVAAALKQVDTCELTPFESVQTNLIGTQNVIDVVNEHSGFLDGTQPTSKHYTPTVVFVSTDKACSPVNVYGMCKAVSERLVTSQASYGAAAKFVCTRYGNVLESRGSIIPLFKYQAEHGECLTVTDPDMTRFAMTLDQSVDLIMRARNGKSGETWIPKLPSMRIGDLASIFSQRSGKPIKVIGLRPGEKLHEDLINESESTRTTLAPDRMHYVVSSAVEAGNGQAFSYTSSDDVMTKQELELYLDALGIFNAPLSQFKGQAIEEIMTNRKA
jgi:FlaA1/EpsC-like NDP-sugar epimerase